MSVSDPFWKKITHFARFLSENENNEIKKVKVSISLILIIVAILAALFLFTKLSHNLSDLEKEIKTEEKRKDEIGEEEDPTIKSRLLRIGSAKGFTYAGIVLCGVVALFAFYGLVEGTFYEGHFREWMNMAVRWIHITFGIAWIGTSFYFVALENGLNRKGVRDELAGNLWAVHGGGFYFLEKYKIAPKVIPKDLHWFKYEAYFTWLSGFCLLAVVYYFNAQSMLVDPNVMDISPYMAVTVGVASLAFGWLLYDCLCSTELLKKPVTFAILGFCILTCFAWYYCQIFNSRAAYIHFGALIGTMMAGNVFFAIIPAQKAMVKAAKEGTYLDPTLGKNASLRSFHNNYLTLPVLFVMISNHFPSTFGHEYAWAVLAALSLGSAGIKHYLNLREKGEKSVWVMPISIVMLIGVAFITAPQPQGGCDDTVSINEVYTIVNNRCVTCHSSKPTDPLWSSPPNGVKYDTPADIQKMADKIMQRVVVTQTMPQNNSTGMLPEEREVIRCWIEQGAKID